MEEQGFEVVNGQIRRKRITSVDLTIPEEDAKNYSDNQSTFAHT